MTYSKEDQLKQNKPKKDLSKEEKIKYFTWIKENKGCAICGAYPEIHHITNKAIVGPRRLHTRVINLCFNHHSKQSPILSIHNDTYRFYAEVKSLEDMIIESEKLYKEFNELQCSNNQSK